MHNSVAAARLTNDVDVFAAAARFAPDDGHPQHHGVLYTKREGRLPLGEKRGAGKKEDGVRIIVATWTSPSGPIKSLTSRVSAGCVRARAGGPRWVSESDAGQVLIIGDGARDLGDISLRRLLKRSELHVAHLNYRFRGRARAHVSAR